MAVNLESSFALCQLAFSLLRASGAGIVIFNSSVAGGPTAMRSGVIYGLTKVPARRPACRGSVGGRLLVCGTA
jgi:NAD(P)-dependent dehydrogenase (short-subunit alcohol dehydrogenase family)